MRSIFSVLLTLGILAVLVLDGSAMFVAYQSSREVAQAAAQQGALEYVASRGNEHAGLTAARSYVKSHDEELLDASFHRKGSTWIEVKVRSEASTYVLKFIPGLNRFTEQDSAATVIVDPRR